MLIELRDAVTPEAASSGPSLGHMLHSMLFLRFWLPRLCCMHLSLESAASALTRAAPPSTASGPAAGAGRLFARPRDVRAAVHGFLGGHPGPRALLMNNCVIKSPSSLQADHLVSLSRAQAVFRGLHDVEWEKQLVPY